MKHYTIITPQHVYRVKSNKSTGEVRKLAVASGMIVLAIEADRA